MVYVLIAARTMMKELNVIPAFSCSMLSVSRCLLNNIRPWNIVGHIWQCKTCYEGSRPVASVKPCSINTPQKNQDDTRLCPSVSNSASADCPDKASSNEASHLNEVSRPSNHSQPESIKKISALSCFK